MVLWDLARELVLQANWILDHGSHQAGCYVPFNMAVEEPDSGIVGPETEHDVSVGTHEHGVPTHRGGGKVGVVVFIVETDFLVRAQDYLEGVAVEMEGVSDSLLAWLSA